MNIQRPNPNMITIQSNGTSALIAGLMLSAAGVAGLVLPLIIKLDKLVLVFGGVLLLVGLIAIFTAKKQTITLVNQGTSTISNTRLIGGATKATSFENTQVSSVTVTTRVAQTSSSSSGAKPKQMRITELHILLTDGTKLLLDRQQRPDNAVSINGIGSSLTIPFSSEGQEIATLLGVQLQTYDNSFGANPVQSINNISTAIRREMEKRQETTESPLPIAPPLTPPTYPADPVVNPMNPSPQPPYQAPPVAQQQQPQPQPEPQYPDQTPPRA